MEKIVNKRKKLGNQSELAATKYLRKNGYSIINTNVNYGKIGEIDIVCSQRKILVFVEVRSKSSTYCGHPFESIDQFKQKKMLRAVSTYLSRLDMEILNKFEEIRFDAISIIYKGSECEIEHIPGAFESKDVWS
jgi:putative endonuclease